METPTKAQRRGKGTGHARKDPRRFSGPIELVTTPILWWSGLGAGTILVVMVWSVFGRIPQISQGTGAFSYPYRVNEVPINSPDNDATILSITALPGKYVKKGEVLAEILQPTSYVQVAEAEKNYNLAKQELKTANDSYDELIQLAKKQAIQYSQLERTGQKLLESGVIARTTYLQTRGEYLSQLGTIQQYKNNIVTAKQKLESARITYRSQVDTYNSTAKIKASSNGLVLQLNYREGDSVSETPLTKILDISGLNASAVPENLQIMLQDQGYTKDALVSKKKRREDISKRLADNSKMKLYFVGYFDQSAGGKINVGMSARILPDNIQANTVGTLEGRVRAVFPLPVTQDDSKSMIGSEALSQSLLSDEQKSYIQVLIELKEDLSFISGYRWVGGKGPRDKYLIPKVGDAGSVSIITEERPPITVALPSLRSIFGLPQGI